MSADQPDLLDRRPRRVECRGAELFKALDDIKAAGGKWEQIRRGKGNADWVVDVWYPSDQQTS